MLAHRVPQWYHHYRVKGVVLHIRAIHCHSASGGLRTSVQRGCCCCCWWVCVCFQAWVRQPHRAGGLPETDCHTGWGVPHLAHHHIRSVPPSSLVWGLGVRSDWPRGSIHCSSSCWVTSTNHQQCGETGVRSNWPRGSLHWSASYWVTSTIHWQCWRWGGGYVHTDRGVPQAVWGGRSTG